MITVYFAVYLPDCTTYRDHFAAPADEVLAVLHEHLEAVLPIARTVSVCIMHEDQPQDSAPLMDFDALGPMPASLAARASNVPYATIINAIHSGRLPAVHEGAGYRGSYIVQPEDLALYVQKRKPKRKKE